ncbi:putative MFS lactose permease [Naematelia encephala]|uniref:Putative MFS lactose permease n=1 Tax=Naematelia encephala TaxID=71784 RepID=A0A1Y2BF25_9TREE|nr:putative MFS lactose permease [Naematelia encephala]
MTDRMGDEIEKLDVLHIESDESDLQLKAGAKDTKNVYNAELYAAIHEDPIAKWSKSSRKLYFAIFTSLLCIVVAGYDASLMTSLIAMESFQETFKTGPTGSTISLIFGIYTVGGAIAPPFAAVISDRYGRRIVMFVGAVIVIVGMLLTSTANTVAQMVVGRLLLGAGGAVSSVGSGAYCLEIAPPQWRGRFGGLYMLGWFVGSIPAAAVTFGTNYIRSNLSWRLPLILQAVAAGLICLFVWFIPESPRFYMANGREEEAAQFLVEYHGNNNPSSQLVALELSEMRDGISLDGIDKRWWDYRPLFSTHSGRWRMLQVIMMSIAGQFSGNGLGYFNTVIFENLGITSVPRQLGYNLLGSVLGSIVTVFVSSFNDRIPRRMILVGGTFYMACMLAINAGLSKVMADQLAANGTFSKSIAQGALAAYFLFLLGQCATNTPLQAIIPGEALENTTRAKGLALSGIIIAAFSFINQFAGPVALGNIGYKYIWVFVGWDLVETAGWYFFGVESQGRTLEQLEWIYNQPNPVKASLKVDRVVVATDGHVVDVLEKNDA